ncbi:MAG: histidine--tRNA ligase [Candidatus Omnitrophica bacterium]|nr:histidine--tRNA ligase [Candidatus Omnitrophota bacterium]
MYKALRGMNDILPGVSRIWQDVEKNAISVLRQFGYSEIRTPVMEEKGLFVKSVGGETDIVTKEMFSFRDRGERDVVLRPEGTAPIVRAYLEANLHKTDPFQKFYYIEPMFRSERPQAGRLRQFHQIGAEVIGSLNPVVDAEIILLLAAILDKNGIKDYTIRLNNLGCHDDKIRLSGALKAQLSDKEVLLCDDCKKRLQKNPLRVLDCKKDSCRNIARSALKSIDFLCENCKNHFAGVKECLKGTSAEKKCVDDPYIVRGLDYYTSTVFEVSHPALGAQDAIGAGGRYDNLVKDMGGPALGAVGFALGVERMLMARSKDTAVFKGSATVYVATIGEKAAKEGFKITNELRIAGIECNMNYEGSSLKSQMRDADKLGSVLTIIIGDDELAKGEIVLRDMRTKEQISAKFTDMLKTVNEKLKTYSL